MPDDESDEPTQETPAGAQIPVPTKGDVLGALRKVARKPEANGKPKDPKD